MVMTVTRSELAMVADAVDYAGGFILLGGVS